MPGHITPIAHAAWHTPGGVRRLAPEEQQPLRRMRYPDGHLGRLATGHSVVRAILADSRFSSRYELMHLPYPGALTELPPAPIGDLTGIDPPEHTRYRRLLTGKFTVRRMGALTERVEQITAEQLDAMERPCVDADLRGARRAGLGRRARGAVTRCLYWR